MYATLLFPNYATAVAAAQALGFWNDPEPIYEMVPDPDGEEDAVIQVQVGMTEGSVKSAGQTVREDGTAFSWSIDEIGTDPIVVSGTYDEEGNELTPPKRLKGYAVNVCGEIPQEALVYEIPYGSAGRVYAGVTGVNVEYLDIEDEPGYVIPAVVD